MANKTLSASFPARCHSAYWLASWYLEPALLMADLVSTGNAWKRMTLFHKQVAALIR